MTAGSSKEVVVGTVVRLSRVNHDAVVLDLDGVLTDTASLRSRAWRRLFDAFLTTRPLGEGEDLRPFEDEDYRRHVDGRARSDGVTGFLASRGITVQADTLEALAQEKDRCRLDVPPSRAVVVEDALPGVQAGCDGGFGLVVGVNRWGHVDDLLVHGADVVVRDLTGIVVHEPGRVPGP